MGGQWETAMVFHSDYEVGFEIYEKREGDWCSRLLGHMAGINSDDPKTRRMEAHEISTARPEHVPSNGALEEWK